MPLSESTLTKFHGAIKVICVDKCFSDDVHKGDHLIPIHSLQNVWVC